MIATLWAGWRALCATFVVALFAAPAGAQSFADFEKCAKRVKNAVVDFSDEYLDAHLGCEVDRVTRGRTASCTGDSQVQNRSSSALQQLRSKVNKCKRGSDKLLCPMEGRTGAEIYAKILASPLQPALRRINEDLFRSDFGPACARPVGAPSKAAADCAKRVQQAARQAVVDAERCLVDCELSRIRLGGDPCVDTATGRPNKPKIRQCYLESLADAASLLRSKCSDALLGELGCPAGASTPSELASYMVDAAIALAEPLNMGLFHSGCRQSPRPPTEPPRPVVPVTLLPQGITRAIPCGKVIDKSFMGDNVELVLEADLSCETVAQETDGLVIDVPNVTIDGKGKWSIVGPSASRYRKGAGIRLADGARGVRVRRIKQIRYFGHGIVDSGKSTGLKVEEVTLFRNTIAGMSISSPKVRIKKTVADRNAIGFELRGDDAEVKESAARGSTPAPGIGVRLVGTDVDGNGRSVRVRGSTIERNMVGVVIEGEAERVSGNVITESAETAVEAIGRKAKIDQNSIKRSGADGVLLAGADNVLRKNRIEESKGGGVVVDGLRNVVKNNTVGSPSRGCGGVGFLVAGSAAQLETNRSEGNGGAGFAITEVTAKLKGNRAERNAAEGFLIGSADNLVDSNAAASNTGPEMVIAPGNRDRPGSNRINGTTFSFGLAGGTFE